MIRKTGMMLVLLLVSCCTAWAKPLSQDEQDCLLACFNSVSNPNCDCSKGLPLTEQLINTAQLKRAADKSMFRWGKRSGPLMLPGGEFLEKNFEISRRSPDQMFRWGKRHEWEPTEYDARYKKYDDAMFRWGKRGYEVNPYKKSQMFRWGKRSDDGYINSVKRGDSTTMFRWGKRVPQNADLNKQRIHMWDKRSADPVSVAELPEKN